MSSFQRMIAIPQQEYLTMSSLQNVREPLAQHFYNLENRYTAEEKERDPYRRMIMQTNTLDQLKQVKDQLRDSLAISTPKPYQSRAKALFQTLESFLNFNTKGEIYSDDGNIIPNSRLEDLIQHAVRDRRRNLTPTGWSDFLNILRNHNVPKSILNRTTLDELEEEVIAPIKKEIKRSNVVFQPYNIKRKREKKIATRRQPARAGKPFLFESAFTKSGKLKKDLNFLKDFKDE